jgi:hypothetical protein
LYFPLDNSKAPFDNRSFKVLFGNSRLHAQIKYSGMSTFTITSIETLRRIILMLYCFVMVSLITVTTKAQNVGIGTVTPLAKLHVSGGNVLVDQSLQVNGNGLFLQKFTVGVVIGESDHKLRVMGGKTWTSTLTAGGEGFPGKMFSVYGNAQISQNLNTGSLNVIQDGVVNGNFRVDGRIGINGPTNASYGLIVNNADSYLQGDAIVEGNARVNGRIGINGPTNSNYGLMVNNANTYLQGSLTVSQDAIVNGNARVDGRIGINGATNGNYGLIVNNANSYMQGNATISGNLTVGGSMSIDGKGMVSSNGTSPLRIGFNSVYLDHDITGNMDGSHEFSLPEFGASVGDVRVEIAQFMPGSGSDTQDFTWWVSDIDPVANTARIRFRNVTSFGKRLKGTFYLTVIIRD